MKKIFASFLALTLLVSPIGNYVFNDHPTAEAKRYKSGKRTYNPPSHNTHNNSTIQKKKEDSSTNKANPAAPKKGGFMSGGLMKGLMVGGLAGLLFGSLFANMGMLGSILGFAINIMAIILLIWLIRKVFALLKAKKDKEDVNPWRS